VGTTALVIAISYAVAVVLGSAIAVAIWWSTKQRGEVDTERLAHRERTWLVAVVLFLVSLLAASIWFTPYFDTEAGAGGQIVNVKARQFAWTIRPARVRVGQEVEFRLTATDVNHGFGVYDNRDHLVAQVQVVPGKTQKLVHTFTRPGTYTVLCLEFCGVGHHVMETTFRVTR
jgi:cytochrome c oxidase subunit II